MVELLSNDHSSMIDDQGSIKEGISCANSFVLMQANPPSLLNQYCIYILWIYGYNISSVKASEI